MIDLEFEEIGAGIVSDGIEILSFFEDAFDLYIPVEEGFLFGDGFPDPLSIWSGEARASILNPAGFWFDAGEVVGDIGPVEDSGGAEDE